MAGLLDLADDPASQGLLSFAARMFSAPGGNLFGAIGNSTLGAMGDLNAATQAKQRRDILAQEEKNRAVQMQMLQAQLRKQQEQEARDNAFRSSMQPPQGGMVPGAPAMNAAQAESAVGGQGYGASSASPQRGAPDANQAMLWNALQTQQITPMQYYQALQKDDTPIALGDGGMLVTRGGRVIASNPKEVKPEAAPSAVREYEYAKAQGYQGTFQQFSSEQRKAGATRVSVDAGQRFENAYSTEQGKSFSATMESINKAGFSAPTKIRKLERMSQLLDGVDGGKLSPLGLEVASAANSLGIKIDPKLGNKEAAQALSREIAGEFKQPGSGPMTDKDFDNFLLQVPDLSKTAEGRKQITMTMKAAANRDMQISKMAREYVRKNGQLDNDFLDQAAQFIAENPVVGAPQGWVVR